MQKKIEVYTDWCHFWRNNYLQFYLVAEGCRLSVLGVLNWVV